MELLLLWTFYASRGPTNMELLRYWGFGSSGNLTKVKSLVTGGVPQQWRSCDIGHSSVVDILQIGRGEAVEVCYSWGAATLEVLCQETYCANRGTATI